MGPKLGGINRHALAVAGSILLQQRNQQLSAVQNALALQLDFGGTRDRSIQSLAGCGMSVSTSTVHQRKADIEQYHSELVTHSILKRRDCVIQNELLKLLNLQLKIYTATGSNLTFISWLLQEEMFTRPEPVPVLAKSWAVYGDNVDHRVSTFHCTKGSKGQDIHWFLLVGAANRVMPPVHLDRTRPRRDITTVPNNEFLPSLEDNRSLIDSFRFHVMESLAKFVPFFQHLKEDIPKFIEHEHVEEMSKKSEHLIFDLLDKNESKGDDMIDILRSVHAYVPHIKLAGVKNALERLTFGGDVLTNERAYGAQLDLMNSTNEMDRLLGIIHRPEGLHLLMNLMKYVLELFYSKSSVKEPGTLYNLSILAERFNLTLDMTTGYNPARNFIGDALDSHLLAAACTYFGMKTIDDDPVLHQPPKDATKEVQLGYLQKAADDIVQHFVMSVDVDVAQEMMDMRNQTEALFQKDARTGRFQCTFNGCGKTYKTQGWLKHHLQKVHSISLELVAPRRKEQDSHFDGINNYAKEFTKIALLYRDTADSYKMGDGPRVFRNIKFLFLLLGPGTHYKYRLWLWRALAYDLALLSEYERHEYKHNISVNLVGGIRNCITNDNLVEIHVRKIKEAMRAMGPNVTYKAARRMAKCVDVLSAISDRFSRPRSGKHGEVKTASDVRDMANCLLSANVFMRHPGREHPTYPNFPSNVLLDVDLVHLYEWIDKQKKRAQHEMQV